MGIQYPHQEPAMPAITTRRSLRQHYRPSRLQAPGWLRQLWTWL
jgi:hypothetical protein